MPKIRSAVEYLSKVRELNRRGRYERALELAQEGLFYWMENARDFYLEMEKTYIALGDHKMVNKMDIEAMRALYWTKGKVTDGQRAKAAPVGSGPVEAHELR
jgi:hypothetical protein